jgi:hypothetical protein
MPNERISMSQLKQLIGLQASNLSVFILVDVTRFGRRPMH